MKDTAPEPPPPCGAGAGGGGVDAARRRRARTPGAILTSERSDLAAKRLRAETTPAEKSLWRFLRKLDVNGSHFRRQAPFGSYVVDFICHQERIIIEVDGGIHRVDAVAKRDIEREHWLRGRGYRVIRVTNEQALFDPQTAIERIVGEIAHQHPHPNPSPQGGGA